MDEDITSQNLTHYKENHARLTISFNTDQVKTPILHPQKMILHRDNKINNNNILIKQQVHQIEPQVTAIYKNLQNKLSKRQEYNH